MVKALGIDVASASWASNGSAVVVFEPGAARFTEVHVPAIPWGKTDRPTATALAEAIDTYARANGVGAIALDGPQGWRDPETPAGTKGVGRRCELACRTQGKTGAWPQTYPGTQRAWIEFSIEVFQNLLARPGVQLFNDPGITSTTAPDDGYLLLECFPTSAWRASGITALPGKGANPSTAPFYDALSAAYGLPRDEAGPPGHDDLQGLVAALVAAAVIGGPAKAIPHGTAASLTSGAEGKASHRVEGLIWDVAPLAPFERTVGVTPKAEKSPATTAKPAATPGPRTARVRVTQAVLDQVNRGGVGHAQIVLDGFAAGTKTAPVLAKLESEGDAFTLRVGDSHAAWRSHQDESTMASFETLFATLSERPGDWFEVRGLE